MLVELWKKIKNLFIPDGTTIINKTVGGFEKTVIQLKKGIEKCNAETLEVETAISELTTRKAVLSDMVNKGNKVLANVQKLLE